MAQATTTFHLAKLIALIVAGTAVDVSSSSDMLALMTGGSWFNGLGFPAVWPSNGPIRIAHAKVGRGPLKVSGEVVSEGAVAHDNPHSADFVLVWQNLAGPPTQAKITAVANLVSGTVQNYFAP